MASPTTSRLLVLAAALLFSTGGVAIKAAQLTPWQISAGRSLLAAVVLFVAFPRWRRFWRRGPLLVGLAYGLTLSLFVAATKLATAAAAIFLQSTAPLYVLLLAPRLVGEKNRRGDALLVVVFAAGLAAFFVGDARPTATAPDPATGTLFGVASGLTWGCTLMGVRWLARDMIGERARVGDDPAGAAVVAGNLVACALCAPLAVGGPMPSFSDALAVGYLGLFQVGLAYVCMTRGMRGVRAFEASLLLLGEPVLNALLAWWLLDETPAGGVLVGCAIILAATVANLLRPAPAVK